MTTDEENKIRKSAYAKGYAAGERKNVINIKNLQSEVDRLRKLNAKIQFQRRDEFFKVALNSLVINGRWKRGSEPFTQMSEYVEAAKQFADASLEAMS